MSTFSQYNLFSQTKHIYVISTRWRSRNHLWIPVPTLQRISSSWLFHIDYFDLFCTLRRWTHTACVPLWLAYFTNIVCEIWPYLQFWRLNLFALQYLVVWIFHHFHIHSIIRRDWGFYILINSNNAAANILVYVFCWTSACIPVGYMPIKLSCWVIEHAYD